MPSAHGGDRVEALDGGRYRIVAPRPKGWRPRRPATRTAAEFPGTTVAWEGTLWEVVSAEEISGAESHYVLVPWQEHHVIRLTVDYDDASERALEAESRTAATRDRSSAGISAVTLVAGLLPAHVQKGIESEYGILATRLTFLSLPVQLILAGVGFAGLPIEGLAGPKWPVSFVVIACILFFEVVVRSWYYFSHGQPVGSVEGILCWALLCTLSPRVRRFERATRQIVERQRRSTSSRPASDFERERDIYAVREPFLALLPPDTQVRLARTFGFDPHVWGMKSAATLALISGVGVASSIIKIVEGTATFGTWASLALATLLFCEQLSRFRDLRRGEPAGSVLGAFVRPFCTELLLMEPHALEKGSTKKLERAMPAVWDGESSEPGDDQTGR